MFTEKDLQLFAQKGIDKQSIEQQINRFKEGFPFVKLASAATVGKGIIAFDKALVSDYMDFYNANAPEFNILKFVPASGAASRMFKDLFEFREAANNHGDSEGIFESSEFQSIKKFFAEIHHFAFYPELKKMLLNDTYNIDELLVSGNHVLILDYLLEEKGLNYANKPKALLMFHKYDDANRLAMEEHLIEGTNYAKNKEAEVHIHFTVSPEHRVLFERKLQEVLPKYVNQHKVVFEISFSEQKSSTDTIAVSLENEPFRETNGEILFRPGGHGALIENLNDLDADIVFIKNIDNVVPDNLREPTYRYKKLIGGHLIKLQNQIFDYLQILDEASFTEQDFEEIIDFVRNDLMISLGHEFDNMDAIEKVDYLFTKMNRPIRVCGMVKNEGEPGGGPFWVETEKGVSLQIVESSQIDMNNQAQKEIVDKATHFNPVDLVCGLKNYKGSSFNLLDFVDSDTGFISIKSKAGRELKAQELPGLWNGAMADWITLFVEVPIETFNPVKSINDLLRPQHMS